MFSNNYIVVIASSLILMYIYTLFILLEEFKMLQIDSIVKVKATGVKHKPPKTLVVINIDKYDVPVSMIKISSVEEFIKVFGDSDKDMLRNVRDMFCCISNITVVYCAKSGIPIISDGYDFVCIF